jgi:hypothetical protein
MAVAGESLTNELKGRQQVSVGGHNNAQVEFSVNGHGDEIYSQGRIYSFLLRTVVWPVCWVSELAMNYNYASSLPFCALLHVS